MFGVKTLVCMVQGEGTRGRYPCTSLLFGTLPMSVYETVSLSTFVYESVPVSVYRCVCVCVSLLRLCRHMHACVRVCVRLFARIYIWVYVVQRWPMCVLGGGWMRIACVCVCVFMSCVCCVHDFGAFDVLLFCFVLF
jgi:hypothetical protein